MRELARGDQARHLEQFNLSRWRSEPRLAPMRAPGGAVSQGTRNSFWLQGMLASVKGAYNCIRVFSETDHTKDLEAFDVPTLILHWDDDQIVPIGASARLSSRLVRGAKLLIYPGAPHGLTATHENQVNEDLLAFLRG